MNNNSSDIFYGIPNLTKDTNSVALMSLKILDYYIV
jgi:hypothetical protein